MVELRNPQACDVPSSQAVKLLDTPCSGAATHIPEVRHHETTHARRAPARIDTQHATITLLSATA